MSALLQLDESNARSISHPQDVLNSENTLGRF